MTDYNITLVRSPGITEDERERRLREAYDVLFAFADRRATEKKDTPAAVVKAGAGASGDQPVTNHLDNGTPQTVVAQASGAPEESDDDDPTP